MSDAVVLHGAPKNYIDLVITNLVILSGVNVTFFLPLSVYTGASATVRLQSRIKVRMYTMEQF